MKIGWMGNRMLNLDGYDFFAMGSDPIEAAIVSQQLRRESCRCSK